MQPATVWNVSTDFCYIIDKLCRGKSDVVGEWVSGQSEWSSYRDSFMKTGPFPHSKTWTWLYSIYRCADSSVLAMTCWDTSCKWVTANKISFTLSSCLEKPNSCRPAWSSKKAGTEAEIVTFVHLWNIVLLQPTVKMMTCYPHNAFIVNTDKLYQVHLKKKSLKKHNKQYNKKQQHVFLKPSYKKCCFYLTRSTPACRLKANL